MSTRLEAINLSKVYGKEKTNQVHVLKNINLTIKTGEFVAIMGKSGSGKSTLLYTISGMDRLTDGQVFFNDQELSNLSDDQISKVRLLKMGFIFQHTHLLKILSIKENILLPALKAKKKPHSSILSDVDYLLERVDITSIQDSDITKVSGGQLQRAAICRALINDPDIIFGDEPTGALNSEASSDVMDILNTINQNQTTLLIVTHDSKVAARADRVIYLADGCIDSEYALGKYNGDNTTIKEREIGLTDWLNQRGF